MHAQVPVSPILLCQQLADEAHCLVSSHIATVTLLSFLRHSHLVCLEQLSRVTSNGQSVEPKLPPQERPPFPRHQLVTVAMAVSMSSVIVLTY